MEKVIPEQTMSLTIAWVLYVIVGGISCLMIAIIGLMAFASEGKSTWYEKPVVALILVTAAAAVLSGTWFLRPPFVMWRAVTGIVLGASPVLMILVLFVRESLSAQNLNPDLIRQEIEDNLRKQHEAERAIIAATQPGASSTQSNPPTPR